MMRTGFLAVCLLTLSIPALAGMVNDCESFKGVQVGHFYVGPDYWNKPKCPGDQCLKIDDKTGDFTVTSDNFSCGYNVASYPNILYGTAWGTNSGAKDLPAPLSAIQNVLSDWTIQTTHTGAWDAAYDIWLCSDHTCGTADGFNGGAEVMIWLDYSSVNGWKYDLGTVSIQGVDWEVWQAEGGDPGKSKWQYVAYLAKTHMSSVKNLDIKKFLDDSVKRGFIQPSWWLYAVQAGNELHTQGVPFTSKGFSVTVNAPKIGLFTYTPWGAPVSATPKP
jgi:Glycosyl hydrolase family 12